MSFRNHANAQLTCYAWEIGRQLRKVARRFPKSKDNILAYSDRLEVISTSLIRLLPILSRLPSKDRIIAQHHIGRCHKFIDTLHGLQELLYVCAGDSKLRPVLVCSGKPLDPLGQDGYLYLQQELSDAEASILQAVYSLRLSFTHNGKLAPGLKVLFEQVASNLQSLSLRPRTKDPDSQQGSRTLAYVELQGHIGPTLPPKERPLPSTVETRVVHLPGIRLLEVKPLVVPPGSSVDGPFPDIASLSWIEQGMEQSFDLLSSQFFGGMDQEIAFFKFLQQTQSSYQDGLPERLFHYNWNKEAQNSAGNLLLHEDLMTSHNHGRVKKREVLLFQNRMLFLRRKDATEIVIWDISLSKDLILVAYNPKDSLARANLDAGAFTVHWKTEVAKQRGISGVKIFFNEMKMLQLWGAFLALHSPMKESINISNNVPQPPDILETSVPHQAPSLPDPVSLQEQSTIHDGKGLTRIIRNTISRFRKRHVV